MTIPQSVADEADKIRVKLSQDADRARGDTSLSAAGKNQKIAQAFQQANEAMTALVDRHEAVSRLEAASLARELFGAGSANSTDVLSQRDAADRATALNDPAEALTLLHTADRNSDRVLVKAVASHAADRAVSDPIAGPVWLPVLQKYADTHGSAADLTAGKLTRLLELRQAGDARHGFDGMQFVLPKPPEVARLTPHQIATAQETQPEQAVVRQWPGLSQPLPPEAPYPPGYPAPGR